MRLPARLSGLLLVLGTSGAVLLGQELSGGGLATKPQSITRIEAIAPQTTEAAPQPLGDEDVAEQTDFTDHNLLYLDGGYDRNIKVGDEFWIVTAGDEVFHPITGAS